MAAILEALGGRNGVPGSPDTVLDWVARIREGLPAASALALKEALHLSNAELAGVLGVSERTILRWQPGKSRLDLVGGDRLVRTARLFAIATEVLEGDEAAARWLRTPQDALGGATPLALSATDIGTRAVEALLGRMEHGVYT